jgi:hypothetical protein
VKAGINGVGPRRPCPASARNRRTCRSGSAATHGGDWSAGRFETALTKAVFFARRAVDLDQQLFAERAVSIGQALIFADY